MALRHRSVRLQVALLILVPLAFLVSFFSYFVASSVGTVLDLDRSKVMMQDLGRPVASLQRAIAAERAQVAIYYARPTPAALSTLASLEKRTDRALAAFRAAAGSASVRGSASPRGKRMIAAVLAGSGQVARLRAGIADRAVSPGTVLKAYDGTVTASYGVLVQAIIQEGNSTQVLPGVAIIELAISDEYLLQESGLLNGDFAAKALPPADHRAFASLVGAHRLLYAQSLGYLNSTDRSHLLNDLGPTTPGRLTALENVIVGATRSSAPPVRPAMWNDTVRKFNSAVQRAVGQAEARLVAGAASQSDAKLRTLGLTAGLGLTGVITSVAISLWLARSLTRRLSWLRDSALELANVRLPAVVRRLRAGQEVDAEAEVPPLPAGEDEIGQVNVAFNAARRTAVEAAVDEAKVRRAINEVFRNLAKRNQALLHRQMALLDALERKESDPDNLQGLFRIDHLTTRMRRHAESLGILAGDPPQRGWRNSVPFVDVLRAAAAEVEDYTRIRVICSTPASLSGPAVADVIHLIAELAENATLYSPQRNQVRIVGELVARGFAIEVEDRGLGLTELETAALNERLANPPEFDLPGSDQLGIYVAGRLAKRHGIAVTLTLSPFGGVTAIVLIPMELVAAYGDHELPGGVLQLAPGGRHVIAGREEPDVMSGAAGPEAGSRSPRLVPSVPEPVAGAEQPQAVPGGPAAVAAPAPPGPGSWHSPPPAGNGPAASGDGPLIPGDGSAAPGKPATGNGRPLPDSGLPDPSPGSGGAPMPGGPADSALPQRIPRANLAPQLRRDPAAGGPGETGHVLRDPETARRVMSAFRRGWREGIAAPGQGPDPAPGLAQEGVQE